MSIAPGTKFITYNPDLDLKEKRSSGPNSKTQVYTIEDIIADGAWSYAEVVLEKEDIETLGSIPIDVLPAPGAGKYYEFKGDVEYTHVATAYTVADATESIIIVGENSYGGSYVQRQLITGSENRAAPFGFTSQEAEDPALVNTLVSYYRTINEKVIITTLNSSDPTLGDGTIKIKVWYKIKTFG